jgi:hypothetical protein
VGEMEGQAGCTPNACIARARPRWNARALPCASLYLVSAVREERLRRVGSAHLVFLCKVLTEPGQVDFGCLDSLGTMAKWLFCKVSFLYLWASGRLSKSRCPMIWGHVWSSAQPLPSKVRGEGCALLHIASAQCCPSQCLHDFIYILPAAWECCAPVAVRGAAKKEEQRESWVVG